MVSDIIVPDVTFYSIAITLTIAIVGLLKKVIKWREIYPFLPLIIGGVLGFLTVFIQHGFMFDFMSQSVKAIFIICSGAIVSYDVVIKKVYRYFKRLKKPDNDEDDEDTKK